MGTWTVPHTTAAARKLRKAMQQPILQANYSETLDGLIGDDELFDELEKDTPDSDVRIMIQFFLKHIVNHLSLSLVPWDDEAVLICRKLSQELPKPRQPRNRSNTTATAC